jgi:hypothetical protein
MRSSPCGRSALAGLNSILLTRSPAGGFCGLWLQALDTSALLKSATEDKEIGGLHYRYERQGA